MCWAKHGSHDGQEQLTHTLIVRLLKTLLFYTDPSLWKSQQNNIELVTRAVQAISRMAPVRPFKPSVLANMMTFLSNPPPQATYHLVKSQESEAEKRPPHR